MKSHKVVVISCKWYILCVTLLSFFYSSAQIVFQRSFGGNNQNDYAYVVQQTSDGGYIVAGYTGCFGAGSEDMYLVKTDAYGDTMWTKTYGGTNDERAYSIQQTADGGYIFVGYTTSFGVGAGDIYLIKTDSNGDTTWTRTYGGGDATYVESGYAVQQTSDGKYIVGGLVVRNAVGFGAGGGDMYLLRIDTNGDTLWTKTYGSASGENCYSMQQTTDGGYILAGHSYSYGLGQENFYLIKTDANGDTTWTRTYGSNNREQCFSARQTSDGGYILAGYTKSFSANADVYLVKTDANGDTIWTRTYGDKAGLWDQANAVIQTSDGGYTVVGYTPSFGFGNSDVYLIKTDANGDTLWTKTYGGTNNDYGQDIKQTSDGGYIIAGRNNSFSSGWADIYLIKTDATGNSSCNQKPAGGTVVSGTSTTVRAGGIVNAGSIIGGTTTTYKSTPATNVNNICSDVLPIELLFFDATLLTDRTVLCEWETATEINNDYFTVEKISRDATCCVSIWKWETVDTMQGAGNSNTLLHYSIIDQTPFPLGRVGDGLLYYRLKQVDFNGDSSYSDIRAVNLEGIDIINLSPNPAEREITVLLYSTGKTKININIYNILGQTVKTSNGLSLQINKGTNEITIDISNFNTGYYLLEVETETGMYRVQRKLIKNYAND